MTVLWEPVDDHLTDNWMFCVQDTGPGLDDHSEDAPMAQMIHESTQTAQAAEESNPEDMTDGDMAKAPILLSHSEELPANQNPGEGVGLSIVKRLCALLEASLELETSPGKGCTFRVALPRYYAVAREQAAE